MVTQFTTASWASRREVVETPFPAIEYIYLTSSCIYIPLVGHKKKKPRPVTHEGKGGEEINAVLVFLGPSAALLGPGILKFKSIKRTGGGCS